MKHKKYDMVFKKEVIGYAQEHSIKGASRRFSVDRKVIRDWIANKDKIEATVQGSDKQRFRLNGGGGRKLTGGKMPRKRKALEHLDDKVRKLQQQGQIKNEDLATTSNPSSSLSQSNIGEEEDHFYSKRETVDDEGGVEVKCKLEVEEEESGDEEEDDLNEHETLEESIPPLEDEPGRSIRGQRNVLASRDPLATSPSPPAGDDDGGDFPISTCVLCAGRITQDRRGRSSVPGSSAKDKDFLVMFVLKKMLRLPNEKLEKYLRLFGHPREWVSFCPRCMPTVKSAFGIQKEINKLEEKLRKFQEEMKSQITLSYVKNEKAVISAIAAALSEEVQKEDPLRVTRETWCNVVCDARVKPVPSPMAPVKGQVGMHIKERHGPDARPPFSSKSKRKWICDICGYEIIARGEFLQHRFMKHGIEPEDGQPIYSCTEAECNFKCTLKKTLEMHKMKAHNAPRRLKCEFCGKGFLNRRDLREHRKIHLNAINKPFQCEICGNSFALRNYLYIHMRLSHQNRPFASTHKNRSTRRSNNSLSNSMTTSVHMNAPANQ